MHGGGKQMTRFLAERGIESRFINGLRVTTPEIIDAVVKVFAGSVNTQLVSAFRAAGASPVGLTGLDAGLVDAEILSPDLGQVGRPVCSDARILELLVRSIIFPSSPAWRGIAQGRIFNVNADQMAVACASSFRANKLLFLTDVDGVRDACGRNPRGLDRGRSQRPHRRRRGHRWNAGQTGGGHHRAACRGGGSAGRARSEAWSRGPIVERFPGWNAPGPVVPN